MARQDEEYASPHLKEKIRICKGVARPVPSDYVLMPFLAAHGEKFEGKKVLDIGTGSGILSFLAAERGAAKIVATDISPAAVSCARDNARRLGAGAIVEARLVPLRDPTAFSVVPSGEIFDVIVGIPPNEADRTPYPSPGSSPSLISSNDAIKLGFSIIDGLDAHLSESGAAVLLYDSVVAHNLMVAYARRRGYAVEHHPALEIHGTEWCALFNTFAAQVARDEGLDRGALLMSRPDCEASVEHYVNSDREHAAFPSLWGKDVDEVFPGMIVIQKKKAASGAPPRSP